MDYFRKIGERVSWNEEVGQNKGERDFSTSNDYLGNLTLFPVVYVLSGMETISISQVVHFQLWREIKVLIRERKDLGTYFKMVVYGRT